MMPARTISEICAIYRLHPEFRDLYVEGDEDVRFWGWLLRKQGIGKTHIYPGRTIVADSEEQAKNYKKRVVALALAAERILGESQVSLTCIVDLDFDHVLGAVVRCSCLFYSDYTSLETHFWKAEYLDKFLGLVCRLGSFSLSAFESNMTSSLRAIASIRLANESLRWGMKHINFEKDLELLRDNSVEFDQDRYVQRYLQAASRFDADERERFDKATTAALRQLPAEGQRAVRGHDFVRYLGWYQLKAADEVRSSDEVARWLFALADELVVNDALMQLVLRRVA
jgi:hypothetical protein